jgi:hypothetical protein
VVLIVLFYNKYALNEGRKRTKRNLLLLMISLFLPVLITSISLAEQVSIHSLPTKGYNFIGSYLQNYSLIFITVPMYWILLRLLQKINNRKAVVLIYFMILLVYWMYSYFVIEIPSCEDEGMLCGYASLRYAAIAIIALFFTFLVRELFLFGKSNGEK